MRNKLPFVVLCESLLLGWLTWLAVRSPDPAPVQAASPASAPVTGASGAPSPLQASLPDPVRSGRVAVDGSGAGPGAGVLLVGRILEPSGKPVPGATLYVAPGGHTRGRGTDADGDGRYAFAGLAAGEWTLYLDADGHRRRTTSLQIPAGVRQLRHDLLLEPAVVLRVRARTADGTPLQQVVTRPPFHHRILLTAIALATPLPDAFAPTSSASLLGVGDGEWKSEAWRQRPDTSQPDLIGRLELLVDPPVHVGLLVRHVVIAQKLVTAGESEVLFEVQPDAVGERLGSLRLQVIDSATGRPLGGARVGLFDAQSGGIGTPVGPDAMFELSGVAPGLWELTIRADDCAPHVQQLLIEPGRQLDLGKVALMHASRVEGVVVDSDGKPVYADLMLDRLDVRRFPQPLRNNEHFPTDAEGRFVLPLAQAPYAVHASVRGKAAAHLLLDPASVSGELKIRLHPVVPVSIQNRIARSEHYLVLVQTTDRLPVWGQEVQSGYTPTLELPRGDYVVDIYRGTTPVRSFALKVGTEPVTIRVP